MNGYQELLPLEFVPSANPHTGIERKKRGTYKRKGLYNKCIQCDSEFYVSPNKIINNKRSCCSLKCSRKQSGLSENPKKEAICKYCNKEFIYYKCSRRKPAECCSVRCRAKFNAISLKKGKIEVKCAYCNKVILLGPAKYKDRMKRSNGSICCSHSCRGKKLNGIVKYQLRMIKENSGTNNRRSHGGRRVDLGIYVRSTWEANYARYLNYLKDKRAIIKWEYEPDTFEFEIIKRGTRYYTPDFKVYENNGDVIYYEIKGYMSPESNTKIKRFRKYYPHLKLELVMEKEYKEIAKKLARLIPNWEYQKNRSW